MDNGGSTGYSSLQFSTTTTIPALLGNTATAYTCAGGSTTTLFLPLATSTQNRSEDITNACSGILTIQATSTDHIYVTSSITSYALLPGTALKLLNENGATWYQQ